MNAEIGNGKVILIEDDNDLRPALIQGLELEGFAVDGHRLAESALEIIQSDFEGVVVCDIRMPGMDGFETLERILEIDAALPVVLITGHGDVPLAVKAIKQGAYDFLEKPFAPSSLAGIVARALEKRRLILENRALRDNLPAKETLADVLVGGSTAMQRLRQSVLAIAQADADVLLQGETGSGKELVSRSIHQSGARRDKPFVALNCGALPTDLIESELFGHEKGAFTGAHEMRIGKIEHAHGGSVLLDEIESMPMELQIRLLRVLEERQIERLGSNQPRLVDVRFIAASKVDLEKASQEGKFRPDLLYRLNVVKLQIPPLRERKEDIPDLFFHMARLARARYRREIPPIDNELLARLKSSDWPGNVRELRNMADRFVLGLMEEPVPGNGPATGKAATNASAGRSLKEINDHFEKIAIEAELERNGWRMKPTYEALKISRKSLYDKIRHHQITLPDG
jgi:two-component system C4-dicarboxylate transport response regulator DctD